ncbi:MAG TPA: XRE family transcriptional regulator [Mesorhizobium sp.]|jgi:phage repressor protein C with HTH and peptisase S24 domain|uniref:XRE family transcriptional regulator n=1 Tax=Mesorhizobium sp. TaxID=1871066 RepID=UPI002DDD32D9|nr:XRE family transcriptional regulator [Mesorhizobium sp.]HEV2502362.1 XRE family transcriptional regulator [Mesorhizobium sp.]
MDITRIDEQAERLRRVRALRGYRTAKDAAERFGFNYSTYSQHERGQSAITRAASDYARAYKVSEGWLLSGEGEGPSPFDKRKVKLVGYVGAGAQVEPDFEQVPEEGLEQIDVPFDLPDEMVAFGVRGDSMLPVFKDGSVIVVYREQQRPLEHFFGEEAAVRTEDGRRFIKTIMRGQNGSVNLISWNAAAIENVHLAWVGEIFAVIPPLALKKVKRQGGLQGNLRLKTA